MYAITGYRCTEHLHKSKGNQTETYHIALFNQTDVVLHRSMLGSSE